MSWADSNAIAAAHAFFRIYNCVKIHNMNGVMLTCLFTLHACYAANFADFVGHSTLIAVAASNDSLLFSRDKGDQMLGARLNTHGTAFAARWINHCHAVANINGTIGASPHTVA